MNAAADTNSGQSSESNLESDLARLHGRRVLVGIASFGLGHLALLRQLIASYRSFPARVSIVVFSDGPKELGNEVEVIVGLPSDNPWSLPFAHKKTFAERANDYDLFIYTEDDIGFRPEQLGAFLRVTETLPENEIAGFLRYEIKPDGERVLTEPWQHFHWKVDSARQRGPYTVAEFTNEHAGFYILTQSQLKRAVASGGFLREPYVGRYRLPETAATDPYTSCGFCKVVPVSHLEDFLVHHIPNKYINDLPVTHQEFSRQIETLVRIKDKRHPAARLCEVEPRNWHNGFQKSYYEVADPLILDAIPSESRTVLSVGAGWGALECALKEKGKVVAALPLDSVIGETLARKGIDVHYGELVSLLGTIPPRTFDCVVLTNLLHLSESPELLLQKLSGLVPPKGSLVLAGPNFDRLPRLLKRTIGIGEHVKLRTYARSGITTIGPRRIHRAVRGFGFNQSETIWTTEQGRNLVRETSMPLGKRFVATHWITRLTRDQT